MTSDQIGRSAFLWYLITPEVTFNNIILEYSKAYPIPGGGANPNSLYQVYIARDGNFLIRKTGGPGEEYIEIRVFVIESSSAQTINVRVQHPDLDISNYYEVAEYYGY